MNKAAVQARSPELSLRDVSSVLFRHKWKALIVFLSVASMAVAALMSTPTVYRSEAKLLVLLGHENVTPPLTVTSGQVIPVAQSRENEINSELEIIRSESVIGAAVDALDPHRLAGEAPPTAKEKGIVARFLSRVRPKETAATRPLNVREKAIAHVLAGLEAEAIKKTNCIAISYRERSPGLAQDVLSQLIKSYQDRRGAIYRTPGALELFETEEKKLLEQIVQIEEDIKKFKNRNHIASLEDERRSFVTRLAGLQEALGSTQAELASTGARVELLRAQRDGLPETIVVERMKGLSNHAADLWEQTLLGLRVRERELLSRYSPDHVEVRMLRDQIAVAQRAADELEEQREERVQETVGVNPTRQAVERELLEQEAALASLLVRDRTLREQIERAKVDQLRLNDCELELAQLQRQLDLLQGNYRQYAEKIQQGLIDQAVQEKKISNISIVQPASYPLAPVGSRRLVYVLLALLVGSLGGGGVAFAAEHFDHSFRKPEDVERRLKLPALVSIPRLRFRRSLRPVKRDALPGPGLHRNGSTQWDVSDKVRSYFEMIQNRISLSGNGAGARPSFIAVMSCYTREGTTTVAANLAALLSARTEERVLLVHAQNGPLKSRAPFDIDHKNGADDIREDPEKNSIVLNPVRGGTVDVLCSLPRFARSKWFKNILNALRERYGYVIFDTEPIFTGPAAVRWASVADGVILVVEAERVRWEVAQRARAMLEDAHAHVLGVVLNKRRFHVPSFIYRAI